MTITTISGKYWDFYVEGREDRKLKNDIDPDELAAQLLEGKTSLRDAILAACLATAKPLETGKVKRVWLEEHADAIVEAGGNAEMAFGAWMSGRVDELAYTLEPEVICALAFDEDESEGDDGEEEEEEDDEEEED